MIARYKTVVVSSMLDSYINGQKRSTFVSATVDIGGATPEQFRIEHLKVGLEVAVAAIQNSLCRQEMSETEARSRIQEFKDNYSGFIQKLEERQKAQIDTFLEGESKNESEEGSPPPPVEPT